MCVIWGSQQREGTFCLISWNQTASWRQLMSSVAAVEGGAARPTLLETLPTINFTSGFLLLHTALPSHFLSRPHAHYELLITVSHKEACSSHWWWKEVAREGHKHWRTRGRRTGGDSNREIGAWKWMEEQGVITMDRRYENVIMRGASDNKWMKGWENWRASGITGWGKEVTWVKECGSIKSNDNWWTWFWASGMRVLYNEGVWKGNDEWCYDSWERND